MIKELYHQYTRNARTAKEYKYVDTGEWCCEYYENQVVDGEHKKVFSTEELYPNENLAESEADKYVLGMKNFEKNQTETG